MTTNGCLRIARKIFVACLYVFWAVGPLGCGGDNDSWQDVIDEPNAWAGPDQNVVTGTLVTLDGSASNGDGDLFFNWSFISIPSGSSATLSDDKGVKPTFTADVDGVYIVQLLVVSADKSDTDTVTITAATANSAPVANAGPDQNVLTGSTVTLDGSSSSDANGDLLGYSWALVSRPSGSSATLSNSVTAKPTFVADLAGQYVWILVVNDGNVSSASDTVNITATAPPANSVPVANAGPDQDAKTLNTVTLDGSASSDADGDALTYAWTIIMSPPSSSTALIGADTASPTFVPDMSGQYLISLIVSDGIDMSVEDTVTITVTATFEFAVYFVQYRITEGMTPFYRYFLSMTRDGVPFDPSTQISAMRFLDSLNNILGTINGLSFETYMYLNCMSDPCVESGPTLEVGFYDSFSSLPVDTYSFEVDTLDGQNLRLDVPFPGPVDIPVISSSTMQSSFSGNDLVLSWSNPVVGPNWAEVDQLRIKLVDINGDVVLYVRLPSTATSVTINSSLLDQAAALSNSMLTTWEVISAWEIQTRAYDANNMNFARGISNRVNIVAPVP